MNEDLTRVLAELQQLREALLGSRRPRLSYNDFLILQKLIPALAGRYNDGEVFQTSDLISDPVFAALTAMDSQALGNFLSRAVGEDIEGVRLCRVAANHNAAMWTIQRRN